MNRMRVAVWLLVAWVSVGAAPAAYLDATVQELDAQFVVRPNASPDITRRSYTVRQGGQMVTYTFGISDNRARFMIVKVPSSKMMDERGFALQFFGEKNLQLGREDKRSKVRTVYRPSGYDLSITNGSSRFRPAADLGFCKVDANGLKLKVWTSDQMEPSG